MNHFDTLNRHIAFSLRQIVSVFLYNQYCRIIVSNKRGAIGFDVFYSKQLQKKLILLKDS
jgi:hypothetical protein